MMDSMIPVLAGTLAAATPLIFAGLGELVSERSGVINLGVEGRAIALCKQPIDNKWIFILRHHASQKNVS